jgi:hypothetical protein
MAEPDPIQNAIYDDLKRGINVCLESQCYGCAVILIYSGIDAMAGLSISATQSKATRDDFAKWCDRYILFPGSVQLAGIELYSARCAVLHTYGVESDLTRDGKCRCIGYMDVSVPEIRQHSSVQDLVLISITAFAKAFFEGINRFLVDLFADPARSAIAESRLQKLLTAFPTAM